MEKITFFNNLSTPHKDKPWSELISEIASPKHKEEVNAIREAKNIGNTELSDQLKKKLPAFTYTSTFKQRRKLEYLNSFEYILGLDFDKIGDKEKLEQIQNQIKEDPYTFATFVSPSGEGIKVFYRIEYDNRVDNWLKEKQFEDLRNYYVYKFNQANDYAETKYNIKGDVSVKDITRLCFVSHDPQAYFNKDAKCLNLRDDLLESIYEANNSISPNSEGNRNNSLYSFCQQAFSRGIEKQKLLQFCAEKYSDICTTEINNTLNSAKKSNIANQSPKPKTEKPQPSSEITNDQLRELFSERFEIRNNIVKNCFEIVDKTQPESSWMMYDTILSNTIHTYITDHLPKARRINIEKLFQTSGVKIYDPFEEKLNSLEPWDGNDHIGEFANTVKTSNQELWKSDIKKFIVAIVASLLSPKTINHYCLVLSGKEGVGKTTLIKKFQPEEWTDYFTQSPLDLKHKDTNFKLSQNFLISIDEFSKYTKKEIESFKELLTRDCIQEREHYGKNQKKYIRRSSFCATLNDTQFLSGEEGERRFWAHEILEIDYNADIDIDKVYAQALALYKEGFVYWETKEEIQKRREENSKYTRPNFVKEQIDKVFKQPSKNTTLMKVENAKYYTCSDISQELILSFGFNHKELTPSKIGKELSKLNLKQKRSKGINRYLLVKKENFEINKDQEVDYDEIEEAV